MVGNYPIIVKYMRKPHAQITSNIASNPIIGLDETGTLNVNFFCATTRLVNVRTLPSGGMSVVVSNA
jgi:hypothetical protein